MAHSKPLKTLHFGISLNLFLVFFHPTTVHTVTRQPTPKICIVFDYQLLAVCTAHKLQISLFVERDISRLFVWHIHILYVGN
jgi:hypothetical protein